MPTKKKLLQATAKAGDTGAWDLDYASYGLEDRAWNIESVGIGFYNRLDVDDWETQPRGLFVNESGEKMYIIGYSGDDINEFTLDPAHDLTSGTFVQAKASGISNPNGVFLKPDGLTMYVVGNAGVVEYALTTAWDVSTATTTSTTSLSAFQGAPFGIFIGNDGLKMYCSSFINGDVSEYDLDPAWDSSTASYVDTFSVATEEPRPYGVWFKYDGLKMYVVGNSSDNINEYSLSTAWDISTASITQSVDTNLGSPTNFSFAGGGQYLYIVDAAAGFAYSYHLGLFDISAEETAPSGISFSADGDKMYVLGQTGYDVNEYALSTNWDVHSATFTTSFSIAAQDTSPSSLYFRPDGLKFYIVGRVGRSVEEYSLSTAWDISTASHTSTQSVNSEETAPTAVTFKTDGTKMYVVGSTGDDVNEYSLSTAWDITSETFVQSFSLNPPVTFPVGIFFKDDGLAMYVTGFQQDTIRQYSLSTAWDVSTASYEKEIVVSASPWGLFFKPDGTMMFIVDQSRDCVVPYNIG